MSNSVRSKSSNHSRRAVTIIDQIKTQTTPEIYAEFLQEMQLFRQHKTDPVDVQRRISEILIDYPTLLNQFQTSMPMSKPELKFKTAQKFVLKVRDSYPNQPEIYNAFLSFLKEFQRGGLGPDYVLNVNRLPVKFRIY